MGLKHRRDTAANWTSTNPTLEMSEIGFETDTRKLKIGDGSTVWTSLAYWGAPTAGDASTNTSTSVDSELALFSSTLGKTLKRATTTGILKGTSGVLSAATAGTDYYAPGSTDVAIADGGTGVSTLPTGLLKGAGVGAITAATAGTDYYNPGGTDVAIVDGGTGVSTLPTGLLKGAGTGAITAATAMTDYQPPVITVARSTNSTAKTSDATAANDTQLFITLPSAGTYWVWAFLLVTSATNADIRVGWDLSAFTAPTFDWVGMQDAALAMTTAAQSGGTATIIGTLGAVTTSIAMPQGYLTVAAGGVLTLQWAQGASQASNTTVLARSRLSAQRVA
jgi:hypothetical protein